MLVELAVAMTMEHDGAMRLMIPCDHRIMAEGQLQILRQERAGGRLDGQIENLCRSLEIVGICPYGTVMIALYKKLLSWKLFQKMTGIFALEECEVAENIHQVTLSDTGLPQVQHVLIVRLGIYLLSERTVWLVFQYVSVTKVKVCGKKYLVHDHRRLRSRFRLKAPGLMVNVSRVQVLCVIGAITDSHSDVLIIDFIS